MNAAVCYCETPIPAVRLGDTMSGVQQCALKDRLVSWAPPLHFGTVKVLTPNGFLYQSFSPVGLQCFITLVSFSSSVHKSRTYRGLTRCNCYATRTKLSFI